MYRDGFDGLKQAALLARDLTVERATKLGGIRRAILSDDFRGELARLEALVGGDPTNLEEVASLESSVDGLGRLLDRAEVLAAEGLVAPGAPTFEPTEPPLFPEPNMENLALGLEKATAPFGGKVHHWGEGYGVLLEHDGLSLLLRATAEYESFKGTKWVDRVYLGLWATIPTAVPRVTLRPQRMKDSVAKLFGLADEIEVGEPAFDGRFWLGGRSDAVRAILVPEVVLALQALTAFEPSVEIGGGLAKVSWMVDGFWSFVDELHERQRVPLESCLDPACAFRLLRALRAAVFTPG